MGLDSVELLLNVEAHYGLDIPDSEVAAIRTVGDLHAYILAHAEPRPDPSGAWTWLCQMIATELGVPVGRITPDAWIVRDLGLDGSCSP